MPKKNIMKKLNKALLSITLVFFLTQLGISQIVEYQNSWGDQGITLKSQTSSAVSVNFSITDVVIGDLNYNNEMLKTISLPGVFLPNDEGAPNLPGLSKYIAIPQGAEAVLTIVDSRTEVIENFELAPAPQIPLDTDNKPLEYIRNEEIYSKNEFYPNEPVKLSDKTSVRGLDVVMLGITPFQYNPVTKELIILRDIEIEISFIGGNGHFGEDRLRSKWWDPIIMKSVINKQQLAEIDYSKRTSNSRSLDYEYLIISPDNPDFLSWADSIKQFRTLQGIRTGVVTTTDVGGNTVSAIESYIDNAYNTWDIPPVAVLLLADYGTGSNGITSQFYNHPAGYPDFISDIKYSDVNGDDLPDIVFARITANNDAQLEVMISKFMDYERNPPTDPNFYNHPITALGWQTERWFQICSEVVGGYFSSELGKDPVRINAVYGGNPNTDPWSTATNTSTVLNYFGPSGLGYIPATPQELGGFSGGTASDVVNAINSGSFLLQHRDHGFYGGWGEPDFTSSNINSLTNTDNKLPYIFSINCQTGAFHRSSESFTEKFHRHTYNGENSGALGVLAATEVSYSFVNDTYLWGVMDNMFPDFMPAQNAMFPVNYCMPAFGNAAGKHFLFSSSWPYNTGNKLITYRLFHHHGDAFLTLYTEVPQHLNVDHEDILFAGATSFTVDVNAGAFVALTVNGEIIATGESNGAPLDIEIPVQVPESELILTITKQNYFRYSSVITVVPDGVYAQFMCQDTDLCAGNEASFVDQSFGSNTSWEWLFEGGTPATYSGQYPPPIVYETSGVYDVTLTVSDGLVTDSKTRTDYITVLNNVFADFESDVTTGYSPLTIHFTDLSSNDVESWEWDFGNGGFSGLQNPTYSYYQAGTYTVSLTVDGNGCENTETKVDFIVVEVTAPVADFSAQPTIGMVPLTVNFNDDSDGDIESWHWDFGDGNTSDEQHPEHMFMDANNYTISLTVTGPGGTETITKENFIEVRDVLSLMVSAASEQVCMGESTQLFADATGGTEAYTYSWTSEPSGFVSDEQNPIISPEETTIYMVEVNDGEEIIEAEIEIVVNELPAITLGEWPEVLCNEQEPPVQLTAIPAGGIYTGPNVSEEGVFTPEEAAVGYNVITYTYVDENGCENSEQDSIYVDQCVGLNDKLSDNTIQIYPNPNKGEFTVSCNAAIERIWIVNQRGEIVFNEVSNHSSVKVNTNLSKGVYFLKVITSESEEGIIEKIIIR